VEGGHYGMRGISSSYNKAAAMDTAFLLTDLILLGSLIQHVAAFRKNVNSLLRHQREAIFPFR
jgi:hypothetical protein